MAGDAADIQNLRSYYTEGQAFFRSSEASNFNSYYTWRPLYAGIYGTAKQQGRHIKTLR